MRNIFIVLLLASAGILSCKQSGKSGDNKKDTTEQKREPVKKDGAVNPTSVDTTDKQLPAVSNELDFLRAMDGKYPHDVKLLDNPVIVARLKNLLGSRFGFFKKTWAVETPIEVKNNIFMASGCEQHNCGSTNFIIVADLAKNKMYAGVRQEEKVLTYTEDGTVPPDLQKWAGQ